MAGVADVLGNRPAKYYYIITYPGWVPLPVLPLPRAESAVSAGQRHRTPVHPACQPRATRSPLDAQDLTLTALMGKAQ